MGTGKKSKESNEIFTIDNNSSRSNVEVPTVGHLLQKTGFGGFKKQPPQINPSSGSADEDTKDFTASRLRVTEENKSIIIPSSNQPDIKLPKTPVIGQDSLQSSKQALEKWVLILLDSGMENVIRLSQVLSEKTKYPQFETKTIYTKSHPPNPLWNSILWKTALTTDVWNVLLKKGFIIIPPVVEMKDPTRFLLRKAFGVQKDHWFSTLLLGKSEPDLGLLCMFSLHNLENEVASANEDLKSFINN